MHRLVIIVFSIVCFASLHAQTENWLWAKKAGGVNDDFGEAIGTDASGNSYVTGSFSGSATFGNTILTSWWSDAYVAKLDPNGNWLWATQVETESQTYSYGITTDENGFSYITGLFRVSATFGETTLTSINPTHAQIYVAKIDPDGNWLWATKADVVGDGHGQDIAVDAAGNCFVTGSFWGSACFGDYSIISYQDTDSQGMFLAKLDPNGNWLWVRDGGIWSQDLGYGVGTDSAGNCYVTGLFSGTSTFDDISITNSGGSIFIAKINSDGEWLWAMNAGGSPYSHACDIDVDETGNIFLVGYFSGTAQFGTMSYVSSGSSDCFVAKLDTYGNWIWVTKSGGAYADFANAVAVDLDGTCFVTGNFNNNISFGSILLQSSGGSDFYIAKLDYNGNWLWAKKAGGSNDDSAYGVDTDRSGNCYVTGSFTNIATLGNTTLTSNGYKDVFVSKVGTSFMLLSPNGGEYWRTGSSQTVYWNTLNDGTLANIYLSVNNGQSWILMNDSPISAGLGRYTFQVPYSSSSQCLVKVANTTYSGWYDQSDNVFFISNNPPESLTLLPPANAGLQAGKIYTVNWQFFGVTYINLYYSLDGGLNWQDIATHLSANTRSFSWTVPLISAGNCYLKIANQTNPVIYDWSDQPFRISKLSIINPNLGGLYQAGSNRDIEWVAEQVSNVKLEFSNNGGSTWDTIVESTPAAVGNTDWLVPSEVSNQCLLRVSDTHDSSINDISEQSFTICSLQVTYPSSVGLKLQSGRSYDITWGSQLLVGTIRIESTYDGINYQVVTSGIDPSLQSFSWTVPDTHSTTCKIKISSELDNRVTSISNEEFVICRLRLISPNGLETWGSQSDKALNWIAESVDNLNIDYSLDNGLVWHSIAANQPSFAGTINWTIPAIESYQCLLRIVDSSDSQIYDECDSAFTILPQLHVIAPNTNEFMVVDSVYAILWMSLAEVSFVKIHYSLDDGVNWSPIVGNSYPASVGRYDWTVPNTPSSSCRIRVSRHDNAGINDISDTTFSIVITPQPPVASFVVDQISGLQPLSVSFTDTSIANTGSIISWEWDFGNGTTSTLQNPQYVFIEPGQYSISLSVTNTAGLTSNITQEGLITVLPRYPEILTNPDDHMVFSRVYLGSESTPASLWVQNIGTANLLVENVCFSSTTSPFSVDEHVFPISISPGDSLCLHIRFTPQVPGSVSDSLVIYNNSLNSP